MNWTLPPEDVDVIEQFPHFVRRFLCYRPEEVILEFVVDGSGFIDSENLSLYGFNFRDADPGFIQQPENCLVRIGTTPGGDDVGVFRVRESIAIVSGEGAVYVNETAYADVPVQDGMYGTIIRDHRIWEKKIRRVLVGDIDYEEYWDYDDPYAGHNEASYPPIANITSDIEGHPIRHFGFLEPGEDYRLVDLTMLLSLNPNDPDFELGCLWDSLYDFDFEVGDDESPTIQIRIPAGFTEIRVNVFNASGFAYRYIPLWAFTGPDDPLLITDFEVRRDSRKEGRDMEFFVRSQSLNIPEGQLIGYFEVSTFGADGPVDQQIDQFLGWATEDAVQFKMHKNIYTLSVGGHQTWLDKISIGAQTIYDPRTAENPTAQATKFIEMPNNTPDKTVHYFLRSNTTALEVMNLFFSDYDEPIEGFTSDEGSVWSTIVEVTGRYFGIAACDSLGSLYLTRHFSYMEQIERDDIDPIITIDNTYWRDDDSPEFREDKFPKVGLVDLYGSNYDVQFSPSYIDSSHIYRVLAPGIVPGRGAGKDSPPSRFLQTGSNAVLQLRRWGGHHYARKNNEMADITISLKGNYDIVEPAWGKPIAINYNSGNARNIVFNEKLFLVKGVEVQHRNSAPFKRVSWNLEAVTRGYPGIAVDVQQRVDIEDYPPPEEGFNIPPELPGLLPERVLLFSTENPRVALGTIVDIDHDAKTVTFTWENRSSNLASLGVGRCIAKAANPWHYLSYDILTNIGVVQCEDILSITNWAMKQTNLQLFGHADRIGHAMFASHMVDGWRVALCGRSGYAVSGDNWDSVDQLGIGGVPSYNDEWVFTGQWCNGAMALAPRDAHHLYAVIKDPSDNLYNILYHSDDDAQTWDQVLVTSAEVIVDLDAGRFRWNPGQFGLSIGYTKPGGAANTRASGLVMDMIVESSDTNGSFFGGWHIRSTNGGVTWVEKDTPTPPMALAINRPCSPIAQYTHDADYRQYGEDSGGGFANAVTTTDDGGSFTVSDDIAIKPVFEGWVYPEFIFEFDKAATAGLGFRISFDAGDNWYTCNMPTELGWASDEGCIGEGILALVENMPQ